jgi:hypothetical protein
LWRAQNEPNPPDFPAYVPASAVLSAAVPGNLLRSQPVPQEFRKKYRRSAMELRSRLQCKALTGREKSRRRKNNGKQCKEQWEQWKKQCEEQWKRSEIGV